MPISLHPRLKALLAYFSLRSSPRHLGDALLDVQDLSLGVTFDVVDVAFGGFSTVSRGQLSRGRGEIAQSVAVKRLRDVVSSHEQMSETVLSEVFVIKSLEHPNIIPFLGICWLDCRVSNGRRGDAAVSSPCIVTMWAENGNLSEYLTACPGANRVSLLRDIANGLLYLHSPGEGKSVVIHRDLHPGNVLIDKGGRAMISDFGLSVILPQGLTAAEGGDEPALRPLIGALAYAAPELHIPPGRLTLKSDVYSFGVLAWTTYEGRPPFVDRAAGTIAAPVLLFSGQRPGRDEAKNPDVTDGIWAVMSECWVHEPDMRPTMHAVCERLRDI
ncbi:kinase-like protein [Exidia glandulosa HHB12029]|uniref:Kinase-like protein n=1 Tax=Exidia glandulosa HHB12029 TaxID=1314781 RepID=A0A165KZ38_EXIGL|nr:kinase-like protein [Exidia glandulosa HHB12029]